MERLSNLPALRAIQHSTSRLVRQRRVAAPSPQTEKFLAAAADARQTADTELAFLARQLVQCTLPHRAPPANQPFVRTNGNAALVIISGSDRKGHPLGIPFGSIPRLLLAFINAEVVRTKSQRVELGDTLSTFCRAVGFTPSNGGQARRLRQQIEKLFAASITFHVSADVGTWHVDKRVHLPVAAEAELWWNSKSSSDDRSLFGSSYLVLSEYFYKAILAAPVPLNLKALRALKRSPLALDLYSWVSYRSFTAKKPTFVSWKQLSEQFGTDYTNTKDFKRFAKLALRKVVAVQPNLRIVSVNGGVRLLPITTKRSDERHHANELNFPKITPL